MKRGWMIVAAAALAWVVPAQAMDMQGKWGLGFSAGGLVGNVPEMTLVYGHSSSTAWLMNFQFSGANHDDEITGFTSGGLNANLNQTNLVVGPGVRRFMNPNSDFSPYCDLRAFVIYGHSHQYVDTGAGSLRTNGTLWGTGAEVDIGAEYFTPWHFSVAAHSGLASVQWNSVNTNSEAPGASFDTHSSSFVGHFGVSPTLALRVYF